MPVIRSDRRAIHTRPEPRAHGRVVRRLDAWVRSELRFARDFARLEESSTWAEWGCASVVEYGTRHGYRAAQVRNWATLGKALRAVPALEPLVVEQRIPIEHAEAIAPALLEPKLDQERGEWLDLAERTSARRLRSYVSRRLEQVRQDREDLQPITLWTTRRTKHDWQRARDVVSMLVRRRVSESETFAFVIDYLLDREDPVRKAAKREAARAPADSPRDAMLPGSALASRNASLASRNASLASRNASLASPDASLAPPNAPLASPDASLAPPNAPLAGVAGVSLAEGQADAAGGTGAAGENGAAGTPPHEGTSRASTDTSANPGLPGDLFAGHTRSTRLSVPDGSDTCAADHSEKPENESPPGDVGSPGNAGNAGNAGVPGTVGIPGDAGDAGDDTAVPSHRRSEPIPIGDPSTFLDARARARQNPRRRPRDDDKRRRYVPAGIRRQIWLRAGGVCEVPGCDCRLDLQLCHIRAWARGGANGRWNLLLLCPRHHLLLDAGRLRFLRWAEAGRPTFRLADGTVLHPEARAPPGIGRG